MSFMFNTPVPLAKLLSASFKNYWEVFKAIILLMVITNFLVPLALLGAVQVSVNQIYVTAISLVTLLFLFYCTMGILLRASAVLQGKMLSYSIMTQIIKGRYFHALVTTLGLFLIIAALGAVTLNVFSQNSTVPVSPYAMGFMRAIIAMIDVIVVVFIAFALPIAVLDNVSAYVAYKNSFLLVKDQWWRAFVGLFVLVVFLIVASALSLGVVRGLVMVINLDTTSAVTAYILQLLLSVGSVFIRIWAIVYLLLLLNDLKLRFRNVKFT